MLSGGYEGKTEVGKVEWIGTVRIDKEETMEQGDTGGNEMPTVNSFGCPTYYNLNSFDK